MNCRLFTRHEVAEALAIIKVAEDLGKDPAKLTAADVQEIQIEIHRQRREEALDTLFYDEPVIKILDGRVE
jgi:hypothetical protein